MARTERARPNLPSYRGFANPQEVLDAPLSFAERARILREWEADLRALLVATDENMPAPQPSGAGETLRHVRRAMTRLVSGDGARPAPPA